MKPELLVRHFGGRNGTLIFKDSDTFWQYHDELSKLGYGSSVLNEPSEPYDRESLIELLSDWGWTGDEAEKPQWVRTLPEDDES